MIRTWPFVVASCTGAFTYEAFSVNHAFNGGIAPHFALPGFGLLMLWVLLVRLVLDEEDCWLIPPPVALGQAGKQLQDMEGRHPLNSCLAPDFTAVVL